MRFEPPLIGLAGYARTGKDTVASILTHGHGYESRAIADALRNILYTTDTGVRRAVDAGGWEVTKEGHQTREKLQRLGAAMRAEFGDDYLIHHALKPYLDHEVDRMVISDVRTVREVEVIHQLGGVIVRIDRPGVGPANHDITERMLLNVDHIIVNDGLIVDLRPAVEDTLIVLSTTEAPAIEVEVTWHG